MPIRLRKLIGTVLLVLLVIVYAVFATAFATVYLADAGGLVHLLYFAGSGLLWVLPAMLLIRWMYGPRRTP
ncbi:DUF2842 domain-containing protein [Aurantimonas sp. MSK8Z-1]|uniref:DUF2842 domain-containing protein n=1 Tax=Mangrovibrevibacter kandeliae TaxID=2968473 RepID=UPI002118942E|nr:DUF2842 domain-containing protein [Aurantimonas sp. MSK8Z-1]MCW4114250.1 DUF2842 domain-containing protein [Aurantimonas sp. MSK8Z-1]